MIRSNRRLSGALVAIALALGLASTEASAKTTYTFVAKWTPGVGHTVVLSGGSVGTASGTPPLARGVPFSMGDVVSVRVEAIGELERLARLETYKATVTCTRRIRREPVKRYRRIEDKVLKGKGGCTNFVLFKKCKDLIVPQYEEYEDIQPYYDPGPAYDRQTFPVMARLLDEVFPILRIRSSGEKIVSLNTIEGTKYWLAPAPRSGLILFDRLFEPPGTFGNADESHPLVGEARQEVDARAADWLNTVCARSKSMGCLLDDQGTTRCHSPQLEPESVVAPSEGYTLRVVVEIDRPQPGGGP